MQRYFITFSYDGTNYHGWQIQPNGNSIQEELQKALNRMGPISEHQHKVLGSMANSIVNRLLHNPVITLKEMAASNQGHLYAEVVKKLFDLQVSYEETMADETVEAGNPR